MRSRSVESGQKMNRSSANPTPLEFRYRAAPADVIFRAGALDELPSVVSERQLTRVLVVTTNAQRFLVDNIARRIPNAIGGAFTDAAMHTPVEVTEKALESVRDLGIDGIIAIGGGSAIGLSKALSWRTGLPQIVCPTTYAGSEMTPILGETSGGLKKTFSDPKVRPAYVIYDVELTLGLPVSMSITSGMNAIAHAVEALYAKDANPVISTMAENGVKAMATALPLIASRPDDIVARSYALYGAWLCATCLGSVGMALHHKLCHTLGGTFGLPHAELHTAMLPHAFAYNASSVPEAVEALKRALDSSDPAQTLFDLPKSLGAEMSLKRLGMPRQGVADASRLALENPYYNPRPLEHSAIESLILDAWEGNVPSAV